MRRQGTTTRMLLDILQEVTKPTATPIKLLWLVAHTEWYAESLLRTLHKAAEALELPTERKSGSVKILQTEIRCCGVLRFDSPNFLRGLKEGEKLAYRDHACYLSTNKVSSIIEQSERVEG